MSAPDGNGEVDDDDVHSIEDWANSPKHRLSHMSRMAGNIAGALIGTIAPGMYDDESFARRIAEQSVQIAEAIVDELVRVEKARRG